MIPRSFLFLPLVGRAFSKAVCQRDPNPCSSLQPLSSIGGLPVFNPPDLLVCLKTTPFSQEIRDNVIDSVSALYDLAILEYNQVGDRDPRLAQDVDVRAGLDAIRGTEYETDYDFQVALSDLMWSLNDEHHQWISCYQSGFTTQHTFPIVPLHHRHLGTQVHLVPDLAEFVKSYGAAELYASQGINITLLAGSRVIEIDGQEVWSYLDGMASQAGQYQDPEQRLNSLFAGYKAAPGGGIQRDPGGFVSTRKLDKASLTLKVDTGEGEETEVTVPYATAYMGAAPFNFASGEELFEKLCHFPPASASPNSTVAAVTERRAEQRISLPETIDNAWEQGIYDACPLELDQALFPLPNTTNPLNSKTYLGGRDIQFYQLHSDIGVIYIPTFGPSGGPGTACYLRWILDAVHGVRNFTKLGVERVLIDTSNNGGGWIKLGQILQRLLTGRQYLLQINFDSVLRQSQLSEKMMDAYVHRVKSTAVAPDTALSPWSYRDPGSLDDWSNTTNLFDPGSSLSINGRLLQTTNKLGDSLDIVLLAEKLFNLSPDPPFRPENIIITGNGLCSSTCSIFTNFLIEYYNVQAYISAARPNRAIEFQASAGGGSTTSNDVYDDATLIGLDDAQLLPRLQVNGTLGFAIKGAISSTLAPGTFVQYRSHPAQNVYTMTEKQYLDPVRNWRHVARKVWGKRRKQSLGGIRWGFLGGH